VLTITPQSYAEVRSQIFDLDVVAEVNDVLALRLGLDEDLVLSHDLDYLSHIAARLL